MLIVKYYSKEIFYFYKIMNNMWIYIFKLVKLVSLLKISFVIYLINIIKRFL